MREESRGAEKEKEQALWVQQGRGGQNSVRRFGTVFEEKKKPKRSKVAAHTGMQIEEHLDSLETLKVKCNTSLFMWNYARHIVKLAFNLDTKHY